ncbi:hypothetical protein NIES2101_23300 [Calothrix sp. HK-06]|nr:hypothetical protein NIES2101_23300 [Calothrix sp. HK-06]
MVSVNRLENRKSSFEVNNWILDSGAFTRITSGKGHLSTKKYAKMIRRWYKQGKGFLDAAVSQDYMNEPIVHNITGLDTKTHQEITILRYDNLMRHTQSLSENEAKNLDMLMAEYTDDIENPAEGMQEFWELEEYYDDIDIPYIMPVLQGFHPQDYVEHIRMYGTRLKYGAWVGVGTLCKRNGNPREVEAVLSAIKKERPDLELHGF